MVKLLNHGVIEIIGPIRQELLSGIREQSQFERFREHLRRFRDLQTTTDDYEEAASFTIAVDRREFRDPRQIFDMRCGNPK
jgi:hypothetical protein